MSISKNKTLNHIDIIEKKKFLPFTLQMIAQSSYNFNTAPHSSEFSIYKITKGSVYNLYIFLYIFILLNSMKPVKYIR